MKRNSWSRALCLLAVMVICLTALPAVGESFPYVAYATDSVRLRARASSSADILAVIRKGDAVLVTGSYDNYKIVEYEGRRGYVVSAFLSAENTAVPDAPAADPEVAGRYPTQTAGSEGPKVKALQQALSELGFYTRGIDSKYGSGTTQAVKDFQEKNSLPITGTADPASQQLLFEGKPKNSRGVATDVKTLPPIQGYTIRPGDRGDAVEELQRTLTTLKYYTGSVDGVYGTGSQAAVKAFQRNKKLTADGLVGEKTHRALAAALLGSSATNPPVEPSPVTTPAPVFTEPELPEASYPYSTTTASSVNMRKRASISAMRILTVPEGATIEVLEDTGKYLKINYKKYTGYVAKEYVNIPEQYLEGNTLNINQEARINYQTLAPGAEGRAVRALQHALAELGFYSAGIDGKFGSGTSAGLKALQTKNGLRATGIALPELQQLIYEKRVRNSKGRLVYAKTLPPIEGVTMVENDFGDAVYELNTMLQKTGYFDSNIGYSFTRATMLAVRAFQKDHSIKVTGKVDAFTLLAIKTAAQVTTGNPQQPSATQEPLTQDNVVIIQSGTTGLAVTRLQQRLVELRYYSITPDGVFNNDDVIALKHFQRVNNLPQTGIADLATQQTLYTAYAIGADSQVNPPVQGQTMPAGLLKIGSTGEHVSALQSRLIALNYLAGRIDGIFGTQTAAAVTNFQRANKLKQDGIAGSQTLAALYSANAIANQPSTTPSSPTTEETAFTSLKVGATGQEVMEMQRRLIDLKYLDGAADGIFGPKTFLAVKAFQNRNSLEADGIVGKLTLAKLNSVNAVANNTLSIPGVPALPVPEQPSVSAFTPPNASEVRYANWFSEIRPIASKLRNVVIYDFMSGKHYNFRFFSLGKHADGTTLTAADTATMNSVLGENNWTPRPVWVIFSDGRVYMASTHSHPHENDYISGNDLNGHLCVHFPREMAEATLTGPYAVSHQNAILAGWDLTQNLARR